MLVVLMHETRSCQAVTIPSSHLSSDAIQARPALYRINIPQPLVVSWAWTRVTTTLSAVTRKTRLCSHRFRKPEVSLRRFPELTGNSSRPKENAPYSDEHSPSTRRNTDGDGVQEREAEISMVTRTLVMTATAADLERSVGVDRANRTVGATWVDLRRRW